MQHVLARCLRDTRAVEPPLSHQQHASMLLQDCIAAFLHTFSHRGDAPSCPAAGQAYPYPFHALMQGNMGTRACLAMCGCPGLGFLHHSTCPISLCMHTTGWEGPFHCGISQALHDLHAWEGMSNPADMHAVRTDEICTRMQAGMGTSQNCSAVLAASTLSLLGSGPFCRSVQPWHAGCVLAAQPAEHRAATRLPAAARQ